MSLCNASWAEGYELETNRPTIKAMHHQCIRNEAHEGGHKCACDPVAELRLDWEHVRKDK